MRELATKHKPPLPTQEAKTTSDLQPHNGVSLHPVLQLQQSIGNQAVQRLLQNGALQATVDDVQRGGIVGPGHGAMAALSKAVVPAPIIEETIPPIETTEPAPGTIEPESELSETAEMPAPELAAVTPEVLPAPEAELETAVEEFPQLSIAPPDEAAPAEAEVKVVEPETVETVAPAIAVERPTEAAEAVEETAEAMVVEAGAASAAAGGAAEVIPEAAEGIAAEETAGGAAAGEAAAVAEGTTAAGAPVLSTARSDIELIMPEPPAELSDAKQSQAASVQSRLGGAARQHTNLPAAEEIVADARGAVDEPTTETQARANEALVDALGERPEPSPEIEELCQKIYNVIRSKRPPDEESLVEAKPDEMAREAGSEMNQSIEGDAQRVQGEYTEMNAEQQGEPTQIGEAFEAPPASVANPEIDAGQAVPDEIPEEGVSLHEDVEATQARIEEAGMTTEAAQLVESGPIAEAREASGELQETAERDPAEVLAQQGEVLTQANHDMLALQQAALEALHTSRAATIRSTEGQQHSMVGSETQMRERISAEAQRIFSDAQRQVDALIQPMPRTAMDKWNAGVEVLSTKFKQRLKKVEDWIEERHSGVGGFFLGVADYLTGLPDWVTDEYDDAEQEFGDSVCALIREISVEINGLVATCEAIIDNARQQINDLFANLPTGLQAWAATEQATFNQRLDGLNNRVHEARDNFNRDLVNHAAQAVQSVREEVHALREKAKGLIGRIADAISAFLEDPVKFIINGLLELVGIPPTSFWALVARIQQVISDIADDPMHFINNLMAALKQGFQQFFDNFATHLLQGFFDWLFSGLGSVGVIIPSDFSLQSIITFFLQLMGITWPRIRQLLVKHIGEENVALIEKAYEIIANLIAMGPEGVFELIKEQLNPQSILDMVIQAAIDFVIETLIKQVTIRIIGMLNPAGAIFQAMELIYKILKWIFENAARIFTFIETIVNGMADIIAGNISGMANAVERALASLIPPVIDFLASLLSLGDLPDKIADVVRGFQERVEAILDRVIGWLAAQGRRLLAALGIGATEEEKAREGEGEPGDGEVGKTITFSAAGEQHRLWINVQGATVAVMVASSSNPIEEKLQEWQNQLHANETLLGENRSKALALLNAARQQLGITESEAQEALQEKTEAEQKPEDETAAKDFVEADAETETVQQSLADIIQQLFVLFGESQKELKILVLGELSFEYSHLVRQRLLRERLERINIVATTADTQKRIEEVAHEQGFTLLETEEGFELKFEVLGQSLSSHFSGEKFDVIIINSPRVQPPEGESATSANRNLLKEILKEAKNYLSENGRIDVHLGPRHPASGLEELKLARQVSFLAAEYEYGVRYMARTSIDEKFGREMAPSNAHWKAYIFEGQMLEKL